ncbi:MAG: ABC-F family ATP-binding cassette domain-containing protein [Cyclonatronaceae bacterium]
MTYLSVEQLSKTFGLKPLFEGITFGLSRGDKTALVAPNGTGKSTLLRIIAGMEPPDSGEVIIRNGIRTGFLEQEPQLGEHQTIRECLFRSESKIVSVIHRYEEAMRAQSREVTETTRRAYDQALTDMNAARAWDYEQRMQQILGRLDIHDLDRSVSSLSGGERKRVALAFVLLDEPDLLLLDEPTNHLDIAMIEWLEEYLAKGTITLLMVTHDRYFLDRICNHIIEIDQGKLYNHRGNYSYYLQKKSERQQVEHVAAGKAAQLLKKELEWMRRSPKARTGKSKSRIASFHETREQTKSESAGPELRLDISMQRMGKKILKLSDVSKRFDDTVILDGFSYSFSRGERIGIIGRNGTGKTTFLNVLSGEEPPDSGTIDKGSTIVYGHYRQKGIELDDDMRVIDVIREIAEVITLSDGRSISASRFLEHFQFPVKMQYTPVGKLSGGERRRLGLMMVLIKNPNFLILDEPTNDLDLDTLTRLEDFLMDFGGCLIVVSHDRFFMEKLVQHYFIFEGEGVIRDFHGSWHEYRETQSGMEPSATAPPDTITGLGTDKEQAPGAQKEAVQKEPVEKGSVQKKPEEGGESGQASRKNRETKKGLSYKERKEYRQLEKEIAALEKERAEIETQLAAGTLEYEELREKSERHGVLGELIDTKSERWLELAEKDQ